MIVVPSIMLMQYHSLSCVMYLPDYMGRQTCAPTVMRARVNIMRLEQHMMYLRPECTVEANLAVATNGLSCALLSSLWPVEAATLLQILLVVVLCNVAIGCRKELRHDFLAATHTPEGASLKLLIDLGNGLHSETKTISRS